MSAFRIVEFIDDNKLLFFAEEKKFIEVEFLKIFTKNKAVWQPINGQPESGFASMAEANNFIQNYKKALPKYHYIK